MTLLGTEGFQIGVAPSATTTTASGMDLSLDEIIQRRNQQQPKPKSIKKTVSNADRSIATSRAKRNAAMAARRGQQTNTKPTTMQVEQEIKKQVSKTAIAKARSTRPVKAPRPSGGGAGDSNGPRRPNNNNTSVGKSTGAEKAAARRKKREVMKQGKAAVAVLKPPSKKAVTAAVNAMQSAGFTIPQGQQLVISFAPIPGTVAATVKGPGNSNSGAPKSNTNTNKSGPPKSNTNSNKNNPSNRGGNNNNRNNNRK